jgi:Domain of unknown function (DUF3127)
MEISGKIVLALPLTTGQGKNGPWKKQDYILETPGQYPKKVCFNLWGNKVDEFNLQINDEVKVQVDVESREYNGRWYTEVKAWKAERTAAGAAAPIQQTSNNSDSIPDYGGSQIDDDLPF